MLKNISFNLKYVAIGLLIIGVISLFATGQSVYLEIAAFGFIAICFILSLFISVNIVKAEIKTKRLLPIFVAITMHSGFELLIIYFMCYWLSDVLGVLILGSVPPIKSSIIAILGGSLTVLGFIVQISVGLIDRWKEKQTMP